LIGTDDLLLIDCDNRPAVLAKPKFLVTEEEKTMSTKAATFADNAASGHEGAAGKHIPQTAKYDRKAIKLRLDVEEWVMDQLCASLGWTEENCIELDLDEVLQEDKPDRADFVKVSGPRALQYVGSV
jgi:hypothetical protein